MIDVRPSLGRAVLLASPIGAGAAVLWGTEMLKGWRLMIAIIALVFTLSALVLAVRCRVVITNESIRVRRFLRWTEFDATSGLRLDRVRIAGVASTSLVLKRDGARTRIPTDLFSTRDRALIELEVRKVLHTQVERGRTK